MLSTDQHSKNSITKTSKSWDSVDKCECKHTAATWLHQQEKKWRIFSANVHDFLFRWVVLSEFSFKNFSSALLSVLIQLMFVVIQLSPTVFCNTLDTSIDEPKHRSMPQFQKWLIRDAIMHLTIIKVPWGCPLVKFNVF